MGKGSRYNQLLEYLRGLSYDKYIWKLNELIKDPKIKFLLEESYGGYLSDDVLNFKVTDIPVKRLVPCQNEIDIDKSLKYGIDKPESLGIYFKSPIVINLPLITYNENFIIDGHHRWSQCYCLNPDTKMTCWNYNGDISAMQMLKIMQASIASSIGEIPVSKVDGINLLTSSIDDIKNYISNKAGDKFYSEYSKLAKCDDTKDEVLNIIGANCLDMQVNNGPIKDAPSRNLMPQTDKAPNALEGIKEGIIVLSDTSESIGLRSFSMKNSKRPIRNRSQW